MNKFKIDLKNSKVLDLFSGIGSFGIECLSRGVEKVIFIENYQGVIPLLKKNLYGLKSVENYEIIEKDIYNIDLDMYDAETNIKAARWLSFYDGWHHWNSSSACWKKG